LCAIFARLKRARTNAIDFARVNMAPLAVPPSLLARWVLGGRREGREYVARNPRPADRTAGSFRISMTTGRWADFATTSGTRLRQSGLDKQGVGGERLKSRQGPSALLCAQNHSRMA
jgi:hypothetical protein